MPGRREEPEAPRCVLQYCVREKADIFRRHRTIAVQGVTAEVPGAVVVHYLEEAEEGQRSQGGRARLRSRPGMRNEG